MRCCRPPPVVPYFTTACLLRRHTSSQKFVNLQSRTRSSLLLARSTEKGSLLLIICSDGQRTGLGDGPQRHGEPLSDFILFLIHVEPVLAVVLSFHGRCVTPSLQSPSQVVTHPPHDQAHYAQAKSAAAYRRTQAVNKLTAMELHVRQACPFDREEREDRRELG